MACGCSAFAQTATAGSEASLAGPVAELQQSIPQISQQMDGTRPSKWKVKPEEHDVDLRGFASVQHDLDQVLPGLLKAAAASPHSIANGIALYRNVNALYDVMVRLQQTAELAGKEDAPALQDALTRLETVRGDLAEQLTALAAQQEVVFARAQQVLAQQQAAAERPKHIVADDAAPAKKPVKKPTATKPTTNKTSAAKPAPTKPANTTAASQKPAAGTP